MTSFPRFSYNLTNRGNQRPFAVDASCYDPWKTLADKFKYGYEQSDSEHGESCSGSLGTRTDADERYYNAGYSSCADQRDATMISAQDIRPDLQAAMAMRASLAELVTCRAIFDNWFAQMDELGPRQSGLERDLLLTIGSLRECASSAVASQQLVEDHKFFALLMEVLLIDAASQPVSSSESIVSLGNVDDALRANSVLDDHAFELNNHVERMLELLDDVVRISDQLKEKAERRSFWQRVLNWLVKALKGLAMVLAGAAFFVPLVVAPYGLVVGATLATGVTIAGMAAEFCKGFQSERASNERLEQFIHFLRDTQAVPPQVRLARQQLTAFNACQRVRTVAMENNRKKLVLMQIIDAHQALMEWTEQSEVLERRRWRYR